MSCIAYVRFGRFRDLLLTDFMTRCTVDSIVFDFCLEKEENMCFVFVGFNEKNTWKEEWLVDWTFLVNG